MKRFLVDYKATHSRGFWVESGKNKSTTSSTSTTNKELPSDFNIINGN